MLRQRIPMWCAHLARQCGAKCPQIRIAVRLYRRYAWCITTAISQPAGETARSLS
ncbi:acyl-CoA dehydrogenase [Xanthomonas oryzae pv. oryzicola]|nr:acyl-CoA dehydrogenase [Xanthomonas oryzae pv. oryzicola]